tara:strand:+ start:4276 stop:5982 length:1707 start_codon:yes stop_codon:yes gene_type:complete
MDSVVYDMSSSSESAPSIFLRKDWVNILDNNNSSYASNSLTIDTSQLSNSNKYMNYREAYLSVPLLLTATATVADPAWATAATSADFAFGLKNNYASVIHSVQVDMQGSTIIQQTPFINIWNNFRLLTSLSFQDVATLGPTIGFYPDVSTSYENNIAGASAGLGTTNNNNFFVAPVVSGVFNPQDSWNRGLYERQRMINFDPAGLTGVGAGTAPAAFSTLISTGNLNTIYKNYIFNKVGGSATANAFQIVIMASVFLRHLHPFFDKIPLSKGLFFKITLQLNNSTTVFTKGGANIMTAAQPVVSVPSGGVNPLMVASANTSNGGVSLVNTAVYNISVSVGARALGSVHSAAGATVQEAPFAKSVVLNCPSYVFSPSYESAYLSSPVKVIEYSDVYFYQILNVPASGLINQLVTNGIAGMKSIVIVPYFTSAANLAIAPILSPWDCAGGGSTSPLCHLTNFNVQVSGQNVIYQNQKYTYESFINQLNGQNSVNGNLTEGLSSGLISQLDFENKYCYSYLNLERMLPIERSVPKSLVIQGQNMSLFAVDYFVFLEYSCQVSVNILSGSRV